LDKLQVLKSPVNSLRLELPTLMLGRAPSSRRAMLILEQPNKPPIVAWLLVIVDAFTSDRNPNQVRR
jgi:hypothetical protein